MCLCVFWFEPTRINRFVSILMCRQSKVRDSVIISGCIGDRPAKMYKKGGVWVSRGTRGAIEVDCRLKDGDTDVGIFPVGCPPPFYDLNACRKTRPMTAAEKQVEVVRRETEENRALQRLSKASGFVPDIELSTEERSRIWDQPYQVQSTISFYYCPPCLVLRLLEI